jgi:sigma-B regulation protein RsbU (phosphoserine phosphatase)
MKKLLICLKNIELVQKVFTELKNDEFFVEIYDKNQEYSSEKFDLVIVDSEFLKELETVINKLKNNTPIVAAFEKEIVTKDIIETFKKGVIDIIYLKTSNLKPLVDSIHRFLSREENLDLEKSIVNKWNLLKINSELNTRNTFKLKTIFDDMISNGLTSFIFDLTALGYMESVGLGELVYIKKKVEEVKGEVKFIISSARIKKLITMANLEKDFEIYEKLDDFLIDAETRTGLTVAIVDDVRFMRTLISTVLEEEGFKTLSFGNPVEALEILRKNPTDIILVDYEMPEMNGLEFIEAFNPKECHVPTIMLTTETDVNLAVKAIRLGASDFLNKPFKKDELIRIIKKVDKENRLIKENKRLFEQIQIREKELKRKNDQLFELYSNLEEELKMASEIQKNILPQGYPEVEGFEFAVKYQPSQDIGGDFYDFIELPNGNHAVAFADISGHGIPASLLSTMFKVHLITYSKSEEDPAKLLKILNEEVIESFPDGKFVSLFYFILDKKDRSIKYCKAAQEPALILKKSGEIVELSDEGQVLGLFSEKDFPGVLRFETQKLDLESGDKLFLYTDGINESQNKNDEFYGIDRLKNALKECLNANPEETLTNVYDDLVKFLDGLAVLDDLTLMCIEKK